MISPLAPEIQYSGHLSGGLRKSAERAIFERQYSAMDLSAYGLASMQSSGARIRWRTDAQRVLAKVEYYARSTQSCNENCAINLDKSSCYDRQQATKCHSQCEMTLFVDGQRTNASQLVRPGGIYKGLMGIPVMDQEVPAMHDYELVFPWGASIDFLGLNLESESESPKLDELPWAQTFRLRYVAFGDSITHGWCGKKESYPEQLAQLNGWEPVNMGIQGLGLHGAAENGAGMAIADQQGDLATILIGINDGCQDGSVDNVGPALTQLLDELRQGAPSLPVAVITATATGFDWCGPSGTELFREQTRQVVEARKSQGDRNIVIVEGRALMPHDGANKNLYEGLHPTTQGVRQLGFNLNAELGFSRVRATLLACTPITLALEGLTPGGWYVLYHGRKAASLSQRAGSMVQECDGRAIMLGPVGHTRGLADAQGKAQVTLSPTIPCAEAVWQVLDLHTCEGSRLGDRETPDGTVGTLAEVMDPKPLPLPPSLPPPTLPPTPAPPGPPLRPDSHFEAAQVVLPATGASIEQQAAALNGKLKETLANVTFVVALGTGVLVLVAISLACVCYCSPPGQRGKLADGKLGGGAASRDRGGRKHRGQKVPVIEDIEDGDVAVVSLELEDGREASIEMVAAEAGSFKDLCEQLHEEMELEFQTQVVATSIKVLYELPGGEWKQLTARKWAMVRGDVSNMRCIARADKTASG